MVSGVWERMHYRNIAEMGVGVQCIALLRLFVRSIGIEGMLL